MTDTWGDGPIPPEAENDEYFEPLNPVAIERRIREITTELAKSIRVVDSLNVEYRTARRTHAANFALAYADHKGPQAEKRQMAILATVEELEVLDDAKAKLDYARDRADALTKELSAYQSLNRSTMQMYGAEKGFG